MFTDIVDYSAHVQKNEPLAMELLDKHRHIVRKLIPGFGGREVETAGDAFLIDFRSALDALQCGIAIQQCHAQYSEAATSQSAIAIRIGLHVGDIEHRKGGTIFGDGVNIAARIEPLAPRGGIALSAQLHDQVRHRLQAPFRSLGAQTLKNIGESIEIFVLDATAIAALPRPEPRSRIAAIRLDWRWAVAALLLLGLSSAIYVLRPLPGPKGSDKSLAVLPFSNLSSDRENEYFTDGIHDSIITHLSRVKDLKVISRTSVMQYKEGGRNLREIARALDVANIVEGSVQKAGHRVRVHAQLIEAATDRHLWAESYDGDLADVFAIQSEVAQNVVAAVRATLTPEEEGRIGLSPTSNPEAYDHFLRATELERLPSSSTEIRFRIQALLEQAIGLDPGFALAHAALARNHIRLYRGGSDPTAQRRDQARAAAQTALRLQPDLAEGHVAMGMYFYYGFGDHESALKEFEEALSRSPNSASAHEFVGYIQRARGVWNNSIDSLKRAIELDPRNPGPLGALGGTHVALRQYAMAAAAFEKAGMLAPGDVGLRIRLAYCHFLRRGDLEPLATLLAGIPPGVDPENVSEWSITLAMWEGRYADAISLLEALPQNVFALWQGYDTPRDFYVGQAYVALGDARKARRHFMRARDLLRDHIAQQPDSSDVPDAHVLLGLTQAYLGERAEALRNADRALELRPIARDARLGPPLAEIAAAIRVRLGDHDRALAELSQLLKMPAGSHAQIVQRDPDWKPLWNDLRFRKLIAENLPKGD